MRRGFTLIEMLVALFIFALITAAGVAVMGSTLRNQTNVRDRVERFADLQRTRTLLKADLSQAAARTTRDERGQPAMAAFAGGSPWGPGGPLLALTRRGHENPDAASRASLQYVEYALVGDRLERRVRPALDGAPLGAPQVLLTGVVAIEPGFLGEGIWRADWKGSPRAAIPAAVRLKLTLSDLGVVDQLFLTSGEGR